MFWNGTKEELQGINQWMNRLTDRLIRIDDNVRGMVQDNETRKIEDIENSIEQVKESIEEAFCSEDENSSINRIHDKLNALMKGGELLKQAELSEKTLDKFEDYMKNVDKLNSMINEFKGCVAISRAAIAEKKEMDDMRIMLKNMIETCQRYFTYQNSVGAQHFKIDAIYKAVCEKESEKPKKKGKPRKKATPPSP